MSRYGVQFLSHAAGQSTETRRCVVIGETRGLTTEHVDSPTVAWVNGFVEGKNLQETMFFPSPIKYGVSCRFSLILLKRDIMRIWVRLIQNWYSMVPF